MEARGGAVGGGRGRITVPLDFFCFGSAAVSLFIIVFWCVPGDAKRSQKGREEGAVANARERREAASSGQGHNGRRISGLFSSIQALSRGVFFGLFLSSFFNSMWVLTNLERNFFCL